MWRLWLVLIIICLFVTAPSVIIPYWWGADVPDYKLADFPGDQEAALNLVTASQFERRVRFDEALINYQTAKQSPVQRIAAEAENGATRVTRKMGYALWEDARRLLEFSTAGRLAALTLAGVALLIGLYTAGLKRGVEVQPFQTLEGDDAADKKNFRQALVDQLRDVKRCFEELPEELARIGGDSALPSLPLPSLVGDPLTDAVADLGKVEVKGTLGFTVQLAKFFVRKDRFVLTGSVCPGADPPYAFGWMIDRKTGRVVGQWEAHAREEATIPVTARAPAIVMLARVLACKILFDNPTAPSSRLPVRSWKTLYHFSESLRSSRRLERDASDAKALHGAAASLQIIIDKLGDDYNLVRFRLGQLYLLTGEPDCAAQQFEIFTQRAEEDIAWHAQRIRQKWSQVMAARKSRLFRLWQWLSSGGSKGDKAWEEITLRLEGGLLQQIVERYRETPTELSRYFEALEKQEDVEARKQSLERHLDILIDIADSALVGQYVEALSAGDEHAARERKQKLDQIFDPIQLMRLYYALDTLGRVKAEEDPARHIAKIEQLREEAPMTFLQKKLDELKGLWIAKHWPEVSKLLEQLRQWTQPVDLYDAERRIAELQPPRLYHLFLPRVAREFEELAEARRAATSPLFLESLYYSAYARFQTFEPQGLQDAFARAQRLERLLGGTKAIGLQRRRHDQLAALALCLKIAAAARLHLDGIEDPVASLELTMNRFLVLIGESDLEALTAHNDPEIRADAHVASGLLKLTHEDDRRRAADQAALQFEIALRIRPRADTYVYLAECRMRKYRREEAIEWVQKALALSNHHPLAKRRLAEWTTS